MQVLQELAFIVTKNKLQGIEILGAASGSPSMVNEFYEKIHDNELTSDNEAADYFYNADRRHSAYKKLKSTLKSRLVNMLFLIDNNEPSYNQRQKAYYECYKNWAAVKILFGKNARQSAVSLCFKILRQAKKYEFSELVLDIARTLRLHYGAREGDLKKFEQYDQLYSEYEEAWQMENKAERLYTSLVIEYVNNKSTKMLISEKARRHFEQLEAILAKSDNYKVNFCGALIQVMQYMSSNDYPMTIRVCEQAIRFFQNKDYEAASPVLIFSYQQLVCHTQLRQYNEGKNVAQQCFGLLEEGSFNWFKFQEIYFFLSMHARQYQEALRVFSSTIDHKRFRYLPPGVKEIWKIFEAYLNYLILLGKITQSRQEVETGNFRLNKFLNETPIFSKDKRGMNIPILIIQILFLIWHRQYDLAANRIEAIKKYSSRYLMKDETFRSNCFIKMILQIPPAYFHKAGVVRKCGKYLDKLKSVPLDMAGQAHEIEIIPYEDLWELVLKTLENKFHRQQSEKIRQ